MAVRGDPDIADFHPEDCQRLTQPGSPGSVVRVDVGMRTHPGVEQDHPLRMTDDIPTARFYPRSSRAGLLRWPDEVAEIHTPAGDVSHCVILPESRPPQTSHDPGTPPVLSRINRPGAPGRPRIDKS